MLRRVAGRLVSRSLGSFRGVPAAGVAWLGRNHSCRCYTVDDFAVPEISAEKPLRDTLVGVEDSGYEGVAVEDSARRGEEPAAKSEEKARVVEKAEPKAKEKEERQESKSDKSDEEPNWVGGIAAVCIAGGLLWLFNRSRRKRREQRMREVVEKILRSGILASDETEEIMEDRFKKIGVKNTEENRREYRKLIFLTPELSKYVAGAILCKETFGQSVDVTEKDEREEEEEEGEGEEEDERVYAKKKQDVRSFVDILKSRNILVGLTVDEGLEEVEAEEDREEEEEEEEGECRDCCDDEKKFRVQYVTKGLRGLRSRLSSARRKGASFAKWRTVITMESDGEGEVVERVIKDLVKYAKACQSFGIVPIVEPEVLVLRKKYDLEDVQRVTKKVLTKVFSQLDAAGVNMDQMILKPNMIVSKDFKKYPNYVGQMTYECISECVPEECRAIMFLSGGMTEYEAARNLKAINQAQSWADEGDQHVYAYSFGRALQESCRNAWRGSRKNREWARERFIRQCKRCYFAAEESREYSDRDHYDDDEEEGEEDE